MDYQIDYLPALRLKKLEHNMYIRSPWLPGMHLTLCNHFTNAREMLFANIVYIRLSTVPVWIEFHT